MFLLENCKFCCCFCFLKFANFSVFFFRITNLKHCGSDEVVIKKSFQVFSDFSSGISSVRRLTQLPEIQFMLNNHNVQTFPLLFNSFDVKFMKCRSIFYAALGRIFLIDSSDDEEKVFKFLQPLTCKYIYIVVFFSYILTIFFSIAQLDILLNVLNNNPQLFNTDDSKRAVIGICRDLRGLFEAVNTKIHMSILFDWL